MIWVYFIFGVLLLTTITYTQEIASENSIRMRRSAADTMSGQVIPLNPKDKKVVKMAKYTMNKYVNDHVLDYNDFVIDVIKASMQITTGTIYKFHFYATPVVCKTKHSRCKKKKSKNALSCRSELWSRPWLDMMTDVSIKCKKGYPIG